MPKDNATSAPTVLVTLPRALLDLFPGAEKQLEMSAATVGEMIDALDARWPGMRDRLCDTTPRVRRHLNIFVEGRRAALETPLPEGAKIYVLTAMSGG
ncbi:MULTISPECIES: MoaD/ThiS family protein [Rhodomicrobium]|uniref:MoaD/ThiS family protein n=1 Tax=Rhodomicrobium TaxID=1068 RepID=UPI000B4BC0A6|nr:MULTISPECIES: MoaD/ThiS family protein [Rhodomicrobium]